MLNISHCASRPLRNIYLLSGNNENRSEPCPSLRSRGSLPPNPPASSQLRDIRILREMEYLEERLRTLDGTSKFQYHVVDHRATPEIAPTGSPDRIETNA